MRLVRTPHFLRSYRKAPEMSGARSTSRRCSCSRIWNHPSLHAKKYDESRRLWQARVTRDWRFYFTIEGDIYVLHEIKSHPK